MAAALFGTTAWKPQWMHQNFLPVIGLRLHARLPPPPVTDRQIVLLLGLWERMGKRGKQCRSLTQAAVVTFGPPAPLRDHHTWQVSIEGQSLDVVNMVLRKYTGAALLDAAPGSENDVAVEWANWALSLVDEWKEDVHMHEHPLRVHCSGLGGGLLSPDHDYDIFLQNHAQLKVYGPSLAMIDDWEQRIAQLGLNKTTHEYVVYQLLATAIGWSMWGNFLPAKWSNPKLLLTRAVRLLKAATIRPSHSRPPHPTWTMAIQQMLRCYLIPYFVQTVDPKPVNNASATCATHNQGPYRICLVANANVAIQRKNHMKQKNNTERIQHKYTTDKTQQHCNLFSNSSGGFRWPR